MTNTVSISEKYERNGWPSLDRPDLKPPNGWSLELVNSLNLIHHHELSPDGERIAFVWERDGRSDVFTMPLSGGWPVRMSPNREKTIYWWDGPPRWSPDGLWMAFTNGGHVCVVPAGGHSLPRVVTDFADGASSPVWMPDSHGLIVTVTRHDAFSLLLTDHDGRWPRALADSNGGDNLEAAPSPDGRSVAYSHRPFADLNRWELRLVDLSSGETHALTGTAREKDWAPAWAPDGSTIAFLSQRSGFSELWLIRPDGQGMRQLTHLHRDVVEFAWSTDGRTLAATVCREGAIDLLLVQANTGEMHALGTGRGCFAAPQWSPDGRYLTVEYEDATTPPDIYSIETATGRMTQLTFSCPPVLDAHDLITPEHVRYRSFDGLEIPALLWRPKSPNGAAVVRPHGGPADAYRFQWDGLAQYLLAKGYTFFTPNFRGSAGYGRDFEHANYNDWGVGDTQDVLHGAKYLHALDGIDLQRIGLLGSSYGGFMVACCLARDPDYLFACGVSKYGDANVYTSWAQCERTTRLYTEMMIGHPRTNWLVYQAASPIHQIENVRKPVLLLHGLDDDVVPPQASEEWAAALQKHDKVYEYKTYAREPHGFLRHETEMDWQRRTERFFDWYLRP